ncbi:glycosyltransferase [Streptomyces sp. NPDC059063]|uniref:glycosyltransferase n=1 Tax=unclassified Streptomyces TaxID=2593676 RepID=UPI003691CAAD
MKIVYLLTWADMMGGTERAVLTQAEYLARRHDVEVLSVFRTHDTPHFGHDAHVTVRPLVDRRGPVQRPVRASCLDDTACRALQAAPSRHGERSWEPAFNALTDTEIEHALRRLDADVLVTTSPALLAHAVQLAPSQVALVHQEHRISELRGPTGEPLFRFAPRLDALVPLTRRTADWFASGLGAHAPLIRPMPNSLPDGFRPRASLDEKVIVCARRLVPDKQVDHAVRAFARVVADHPDWELRIFGEGPQLPSLRRLAKALDVQDQVRFYGPTRHIAEEFAKASVSVLPSRTEAWGLVIIESWAAGVPVVAYDCPTGPGEIITDGVDGLLAAPDDVDALADGLRALIEDRTKRHRMGRAALESVRRFAPDAVLPALEAIYHEVLSARRDPAFAARRTDRVAAHRAATGGHGFAPAAAPGPRPLTGPDTTRVEERLLRDLPGVIRSAGRIALIRDDLGPHDAATANLELVADALSAAGEPFRVIRDPGLRHRVAVTRDRMAPVLAALAARRGEQPVYADLLDRRGGVARSVHVSALADLDQGSCAVARVFRPVVTSGRSLHLGSGYGCDLEFWDTDPRTGALVPSRATVVGAELPADAQRPATLRVGDRAYPTFEPFTWTLVDDITFPIDAVYSRGATGPCDPGDELRYSLRSLAMHAPWIRTIHLVTDGRCPAWLNADHPRIAVVAHQESTPVHRIEGLAEHFLHLDAHTFLGRPSSAAAFFHANGTAKHFTAPAAVPLTAPRSAAEQHLRDLITGTFGKHPVNAFLPGPHALRRSVLAEMEERWPDVSATSALHHCYAHLTGRSVPADLSSDRVDLGRAEAHYRLTRLLTWRNRDVFRLDGTHDGDLPVPEQEAVRTAFLENYFPVASPYERPE